MRVNANAAQQPLREGSAQQSAAGGSRVCQQGAAQPPVPRPRSPLRKAPTPPKVAGLAWERQRQLSGALAQSACRPADGAAIPAADQDAAAAEHAVFPEQGCSSSAAAARQARSVEQPAALSGDDKAAGTSSPPCAAHCEEGLAAAVSAPAGHAASLWPAGEACCDMATLQREVQDLKEQVRLMLL